MLVPHKPKPCHAPLTVAQQGSARKILEEKPTGRKDALCQTKAIMET